MPGPALLGLAARLGAGAATRGGASRASRLLPRIAGRRRREYGRRLLRNMGFNLDVGGGGRGGVVGSAGIRNIGGFNITIPGTSSVSPTFSIDIADRVSNKSNPTVSTILNQINILVQLADKIGALTKDQQRTIINQLKAAQRVSRSQQSVSSPGIPEPMTSSIGADLSQVDDVINKLIKQIGALTNTVNDRIEDADGPGQSFTSRFLGNMGFDTDVYERESSRRSARRRRRRLNRAGIRTEIDPRTGNTRYRGSDGRFVSAQNVERIANTSRLSSLSTVTGQVGKTVSQKVSNIRAATAAGPGGLKQAIKAAAGPLVKQSIGKIATRSIPIIGIGLGGLAAISRLMEGDIVGAGIDAASGFGSLATAIPLITASVTRDVYRSVFNVNPETDPQFFSRMAMVKEVVEQLVKSALSDKVDPKSTPTENEVKKKLLPEDTPKDANAARQKAASLTSEPPPAPPPPPPSTTPSPSPSPAKSSTVKPEPASSGETGSVSQTMDTSATESMSTKLNDTGAQIMTASEPPSVAPVSNLGYNSDMGRFMPQMTATPIGGRVGIGNVPNPDYIPSGKNNLGDIFKIMFFNVNYQEL